MTCYMMTWDAFLDVEPARPIDRDLILKFLNTVEKVDTWRASTGAIFIASDADVQTLSDALNRKFPKLLFILTPIDNDRTQGWTDKDTWDFIEKYATPQRRGRGIAD